MFCEEYHGLSRYGANVPCRNWFKKVININTTTNPLIPSKIIKKAITYVLES